MIESERQKDQNSCNETGMDVIDSHKTKMSKAITCIGSMVSMWDITSLCINICAVILTITTDMGPKPIFHWVLITISQITINQDWDKWMETCGIAMPHLHFHFYSFIDRIWALLAQGATEFNNINVVTGNHPISDLNLAHHIKEMNFLKALVDQVTLAQYHGSSILVQAFITSKYCPLAVYSIIWPKLTIPKSTPRNTPATTSGQNTKRDPATPKGGQSRNKNKHPK